MSQKVAVTPLTPQERLQLETAERLDRCRRLRWRQPWFLVTGWALLVLMILSGYLLSRQYAEYVSSGEILALEELLQAHFANGAMTILLFLASLASFALRVYDEKVHRLHDVDRDIAFGVELALQKHLGGDLEDYRRERGVLELVMGLQREFSRHEHVINETRRIVEETLAIIDRTGGLARYTASQEALTAVHALLYSMTSHVAEQTDPDTTLMLEEVRDHLAEISPANTLPAE